MVDKFFIPSLLEFVASSILSFVLNQSARFHCTFIVFARDEVPKQSLIKTNTLFPISMLFALRSQLYAQIQSRSRITDLEGGGVL